jgi:hypothetical protein
MASLSKRPNQGNPKEEKMKRSEVRMSTFPLMMVILLFGFFILSSRQETLEVGLARAQPLITSLPSGTIPLLDGGDNRRNIRGATGLVGMRSTRDFAVKGLETFRETDPEVR